MISVEKKLCFGLVLLVALIAAVNCGDNSHVSRLVSFKILFFIPEAAKSK
jgi:hypothetical protein